MGEIKKTILVVDDSPISRAQIKAALGEEYSIIEASNGEEAVVQIIRNENQTTGKNNMDGIILDLNMPKMNGISVLEKTRVQGIPVIVVTGAELEVQAGVCKEFEDVVFDSIAKPINSAALKSKVSTMLAVTKENTSSKTR